MRIDANTATAGSIIQVDHSRARPEVVIGVLCIYPAFDRVTARMSIYHMLGKVSTGEFVVLGFGKLVRFLLFRERLPSDNLVYMEVISPVQRLAALNRGIFLSTASVQHAVINCCPPKPRHFHVRKR